MSRRGWLWTMGTPLRLACLGLIGLYRVSIGQVVGGRCRFYPSCSAYAEQAVRELGVTRGIGLAVWRLLRCGPWTRGGIDHPPRYEAVIRGLPRTAPYDATIQVRPAGAVTGGERA